MAFSENFKVEISLLTKNNGVCQRFASVLQGFFSKKKVLSTCIAIINPKSLQSFLKAFQRLKKNSNSLR